MRQCGETGNWNEFSSNNRRDVDKEDYSRAICDCFLCAGTFFDISFNASESTNLLSLHDGIKVHREDKSNPHFLTKRNVLSFLVSFRQKFSPELDLKLLGQKKWLSKTSEFRPQTSNLVRGFPVFKPRGNPIEKVFLIIECNWKKINLFLLEARFSFSALRPLFVPWSESWFSY